MLATTEKFNKLAFKMTRKVRSSESALPEDFLVLDIGAFALKALECHYDNKKISNILYCPWDPVFREMTFSQKIQDTRFIHSLENILHSHGFVSKNLVLLADYEKLVMRQIVMPPNISKTKINTLLRSDFKDELPYDFNDIYFDTVVIDSNDKESLVHLYATERKEVDTLIEMLDTINYRVYEMDVSPIASRRAILHNFSSNKLEDNTIVANIDIGSTVTTISIFDKSKILLYNVIPLGGNHISQAFASDYNLDIYEAEKIKYQQGLLGIDVCPAVKDIQMAMFTAYWHVIQHYMSNNNLRALKNIYLSGGGANTKGLEVKFLRFLELQAHRIEQIHTLSVIRADTLEMDGFFIADDTAKDLQDSSLMFLPILGACLNG